MGQDENGSTITFRLGAKTWGALALGVLTFFGSIANSALSGAYSGGQKLEHISDAIAGHDKILETLVRAQSDLTQTVHDENMVISNIQRHEDQQDGTLELLREEDRQLQDLANELRKHPK